MIEDATYYYMRGGQELMTTSLNVAILRRDPGTSIMIGDGESKKLINLT